MATEKNIPQPDDGPTKVLMLLLNHLINQQGGHITMNYNDLPAKCVLSMSFDGDEFTVVSGNRN